MFAAIYKWKLNEGISAEEWEENWSKGTAFIHKKHGSLGASLHKTDDGLYLSYARWNKKSDWEVMMGDESPEKAQYSNDPFVTQVAPPMILEMIDDQLVIG